jgi:hypothetical protein
MKNGIRLILFVMKTCLPIHTVTRCGQLGGRQAKSNGLSDPNRTADTMTYLSTFGK